MKTRTIVVEIPLPATPPELRDGDALTVEPARDPTYSRC
jgi:hypothetical protein